MLTLMQNPNNGLWGIFFTHPTPFKIQTVYHSVENFLSEFEKEWRTDLNNPFIFEHSFHFEQTREKILLNFFLEIPNEKIALDFAIYLSDYYFVDIL